VGHRHSSLPSLPAAEELLAPTAAGRLRRPRSECQIR
jgi:hypothetical protein